MRNFKAIFFLSTVVKKCENLFSRLRVKMDATQKSFFVAPSRKEIVDRACCIVSFWWRHHWTEKKQISEDSKERETREKEKQREEAIGFRNGFSMLMCWNQERSRIACCTKLRGQRRDSGKRFFSILHSSTIETIGWAEPTARTQQQQSFWRYIKI